MPRTKSTALATPETRRVLHVVDAAGVSVGRLASQIAILLIGKHKTTFAPHLDIGDLVEVRNPEQAVFTGMKTEQKLYHRYSGYPGGIRSVRAGALLASKPNQLILLAIKRMLPKNSHVSARLRRVSFKSGVNK